MDLFVVNRYEGEEPVNTESSNNHLSELLKRIEERKRQKAAAVSDEKTDATSEEKTDAPSEEKTDAPSEANISRKKGRKRKLSKKSEASSVSIKDEDCSEPSIKAKQTKIDNAEEAPDPTGNFTILDAGLQRRKKLVKRVLPRWLAHPEIISSDLGSGPLLDNLDKELDPRLVTILKSNGMEKLFPVQWSIVTWLLKCNRDRERGLWPRDTCVSAPTGSGKTLAYVLPVVQQLQSRLVPKIRCLVVLPVQELAAQVYKVFLTYSAGTKLKVGLLTGASMFQEEQINLVKKTQNGHYESRVDIVIATPGRLVDHIEKTEGFSLADLKFLVIDEADRATDWLQHIPAPHSRSPPLTLGNVLRSENRPAQKLLFSATLSQDPEKLSRLGLFQPILFTSVVASGRDDDIDLDKEAKDFVGRYTSPDELEERAVQCSAEYKPLALHQLLTASATFEKALVFTNSGEAAHRLALLLRLLLKEKCIAVGELSAQMSSKERTCVLEKFATGSIHVLVSSDALARGLDIPGVKLVVAYDLPKHIAGYIHRAGRTGRGGTPGTAISLLMSNQTAAFTQMLNNAKKTVPTIEILDSLEDVAERVNYQKHIERLKETLIKERADLSEKVKSTKRRHGVKN